MQSGRYSRVNEYVPIAGNRSGMPRTVQPAWSTTATPHQHEMKDFTTPYDSMPTENSGSHWSRFSLGKPCAKKRLELSDFIVLCLSLVCLLVAIIAIADNCASFTLGTTNQLIVSGFLLSIMNLCFSKVTPTLFLHLEARYGRSSLQNYDGILRSQVLRPQLDYIWRAAIFFSLALPIGLSVAYKTFRGGESYVPVVPSSLTGSTSYYGMFGSLGISSKGKVGFANLMNATSAFTEAALPLLDGSDPPLPAYP